MQGYQPTESFEHARRRVFKGVRGRKHASRFELAAREVRRSRRSAEEMTGKRLSAEAAENQLADNRLHKLCDPKEIEKRRTRKAERQPGRFEIKSELHDTPLGRKVAAAS